jgi:molybdenum cofactor synthesis domain-containing protein
MLKTRPVEEVTRMIANRFGEYRVGTEKVPLQDALGRVLSEHILATAFIPNFNRATVDGYAVLAGDILDASESSPTQLKLIGVSHMGAQTTFTIRAGQCAYVPTGGEVPQGTDTMVMIEDTHLLSDDTVAFSKPYVAGLNLIYRGEDTQPGDRIIPSGKRLKVADTGTLAAMGITQVPVFRQPRVAIISTGDEIVPADQPISGGLIRDVNSPMLRNAVMVNGGQPILHQIVKDSPAAITAAVSAALSEADMLLVSGGTSMDSRDAVTSVFTDLGEVYVHGITVKPGKPTIFGAIQDKPVFGLPGNPVSAYFTFQLFVRPLLHSLQGTRPVDHHITLPLARDVVTNHGREECVPVIIGDGLAHPVASKSGLITTVSCADGYFRIPRDLPGRNKGDLVDIIYLDR